MSVENKKEDNPMGMAASQARYLALTARKTNVEYEGQQINQSRLMLANQSADLFNQMLGMQVPTAPSSTDFSKLQYSFTDGINTSILDNYYQIGDKDSEYNYVVTTHHTEKVYTGSKKLMNDPQVQAVKTDKYSYDPATNHKELYVKALLPPTQTGNGSYIITDSNNYKHTFRPVDNNNSLDRMKINAISGTNLVADYFSYNDGADTYTYTDIKTSVQEQGVALTSFVNAGSGYTYNGQTYEPVDLTALDVDDQQYKNMLAIYGSDFESDVAKVKAGGVAENKYYKSTTTDLYAKNLDGTNGATTSDINEVTNTQTQYNKVDTSDTGQEAELIKVFGTDYDKNDSYYVDANGNYISANDIKSAQSSLDHKDKSVISGNSKTAYFKDENGNYAKEADLKILTVGSKLSIYTASYTPTFSNYTAVGNSKLTAITADDYKKDSTISTEIEQIIKDMKGPNGSTASAENFAKCFNAAGEYIGGIYSFEKDGVKYYTTVFDLEKSVSSAYKDDSIADNGIDGQQDKLAYYNATYLDTKVTETKKALLDTDGQGRFSTVRFEDDSAVYTLNVETIIDEAAYNDAVNQYNYKQKEYDKAIADINAKTEIIQAQDRNLELRLEQLNTEQSALQNEMEAVKKVVDKHVEQGFKVFGG